MEQHQIRQKLEQLSYLEMANLTDHFQEISVWVNEYKQLYGCDEFINEFVTDYLQLHRSNQTQLYIRKHRR